MTSANSDGEWIGPCAAREAAAEWGVEVEWPDDDVSADTSNDERGERVFIAYGYSPEATDESVETIIFGVGVDEQDARQAGEKEAAGEGFTGSLHVLPASPQVIAAWSMVTDGVVEFVVTDGVAHMSGESVSAETAGEADGDVASPGGNLAGVAV